MRRALVALTMLGLASAAASEPSRVLVEDWSGHRAGHAGIPEGWKGQTWGSPRYDFAVIADGPGQVLRLRSRGDNSTVSKEIRVDVRRFPLLVWRWKVTTLPAGGDSRRKEAAAQAAPLSLPFPRSPTALRSRIIGYVWDTQAPAGAVVRSEPGRPATYVVVRSGEADVGRWIVETRDVAADYRAIWGEEPAEEARVLSVAIDSNDTRSSAESFIAEIVFRAR